MNTGTNDFDKLRKLLKLKRYEQPPPGYFNHFSSLVINRIEREGRAEETLEEVPQWLTRFFGIFRASPVFSGLFGAALCAVVIFGISAANKGAKTPAIAFQPPPMAIAEANASDVLANNASHNESLGHSTDPVLSSVALGSPFAANGDADARIQTVSFTSAHQ